MDGEERRAGSLDSILEHFFGLRQAPPDAMDRLLAEQLKTFKWGEHDDSNQKPDARGTPLTRKDIDDALLEAWRQPMIQSAPAPRIDWSSFYDTADQKDSFIAVDEDGTEHPGQESHRQIDGDTCTTCGSYWGCDCVVG